METATIDGQMLVNGEFKAGGDGWSDDFDPGNGELVGRVAECTDGDLDDAVAAAVASQPSWSALPAGDRADVLIAAARSLSSTSDDWAQLMTREMGKPLAEARIECGRAARILEYFAGEALRPIGENFHQDRGGGWLFTRREPTGVVGLITPWNFPAAIPTWKLGPALVFGNSVVLKPARDATLTALRLVEALVDAGLPAGVLNVVPGPGAQLGMGLVEHRDVDAISFTGSVEVGQAILAAASTQAKKVQLELGGHNPVIIREDAPLDAAVAAVALGAFASAGQKCTSTRRVYVARAVYEEFLTSLSARANALTVGYGLDDGTEIGPLVGAQQLEDVAGAVQSAEATGGRVIAGGQPATEGKLGLGNFMQPTVIVDLPHDAELACNEVFGPVVSVWPYDHDHEAIELANRLPYALSAAIFTSDLKAAQTFVESIEAGLVHVNSQTAGADVHVPFGGLGQSGYGAHEQGRSAIEFYTEQKTVYFDPPAP